MTIIMKGSEVSSSVKAQILNELHGLNVTPTLAVIRVGSRPDDLAYERGIIKRFDSLGLRVKFMLSMKISHRTILTLGSWP